MTPNEIAQRGGARAFIDPLADALVRKSQSGVSLTDHESELLQAARREWESNVLSLLAHHPATAIEVARALADDSDVHADPNVQAAIGRMQVSADRYDVTVVCSDVPATFTEQRALVPVYSPGHVALLQQGIVSIDSTLSSGFPDDFRLWANGLIRPHFHRTWAPVAIWTGPIGGTEAVLGMRVLAFEPNDAMLYKLFR